MNHIAIRVAAVVVTYNCGFSILENVGTYLHKVGLVIIVDNGSNDETKRALEECRRRNAQGQVVVILREKNEGIATAQNIGIRAAMQRGFSWVQLFDHDSAVEEKMLERLFSFAEQAPADIAVIGPNIYDVNIDTYNRYVVRVWGPFFRRVRPAGEIRTDVLALFASGSLIRISALNDVGLMRDEYFIDFVDTEFCLRCIAAGYRIAVLRDAVLLHRLGEREIKYIAGVPLKPTHHSVFRKYYMARNRLAMWRQYWLRVPSYIAFDMAAALLDLFRVVAYERERRAKLRATMRGYWDGLMGRTGPAA